MSEKDIEKNIDEIIEDNVRKVFDGETITDVMSGCADKIKDEIAKRNENVIKSAEKHGAHIAHISIEEVDDMAFPFKDHLVIASDAGIGVIGELDPSDLAELLANVTKAVLIRYGLDPDDKTNFNIKAATVIMLSAIDFIAADDMPRKVVSRFKRLMDSIEDLLKD